MPSSFPHAGDTGAPGPLAFMHLTDDPGGHDLVSHLSKTRRVIQGCRERAMSCPGHRVDQSEALVGWTAAQAIQGNIHQVTVVTLGAFTFTGNTSGKCRKVEKEGRRQRARVLCPATGQSLSRKQGTETPPPPSNTLHPLVPAAHSLPASIPPSPLFPLCPSQTPNSPNSPPPALCLSLTLPDPWTHATLHSIGEGRDQWGARIRETLSSQCW